ncbi:hypothetical protein [Clostridium sp.]|uniref:hypothetical protein n=1 Tax=Clostridium sp. TaxID=1506 RepID=UPI003F3BBBC2
MDKKITVLRKIRYVITIFIVFLFVLLTLLVGIKILNKSNSYYKSEVNNMISEISGEEPLRFKGESIIGDEQLIYNNKILGGITYVSVMSNDKLITANAYEFDVEILKLEIIYILKQLMENIFIDILLLRSYRLYINNHRCFIKYSSCI